MSSKVKSWDLRGRDLWVERETLESWEHLIKNHHPFDQQATFLESSSIIHGINMHHFSTSIKCVKVRKEKNVCVVVVALSWYRALLTSSVQQQQQHKHFFLSLLYKVSQNKIGFWIFKCWILFLDRLVKLDNLSPVIIIIMSRIFPMEHCDSLTPLQSLF